MRISLRPQTPTETGNKAQQNQGKTGISLHDTSACFIPLRHQKGTHPSETSFGIFARKGACQARKTLLEAEVEPPSISFRPYPSFWTCERRPGEASKKTWVRIEADRVQVAALTGAVFAVSKPSACFSAADCKEPRRSTQDAYFPLWQRLRFE